MSAIAPPSGSPALPRIGYVGVGDMGRPLARRLLRAGFALTVCDLSEAATESLRAEGAHVAVSPAEAASRAEIVFACLPSPAASEAVAFGADGVIHGRTVRVYVENSTSGEPVVRRVAAALKARGIGVLDAPVSGGPRGEAAGRLTCFVSGAHADFERARPALATLSDRLFHVGEEPGQSQVLKLANNLLNAANLTAACEMMQMVVRAGIDPATAIDVINASTGRSRATEETFGSQLLNGRYSTGARLEILQKDVALAAAAAERFGVSHLVTDSVRAVWDAAVAAGRGGEDLSRIYDFIASQPARSGRD